MHRQPLPRAHPCMTAGQVGSGLRGQEHVAAALGRARDAQTAALLGAAMVRLGV